MGTWGAGLYSGDFAMDLRSTIGAVARLPFAGDELLKILSDSEPSAANDQHDEDYTSFWLVVADQFDKRAIVCDRAREEALRIIDSGSDLALLTKLGMRPQDLKKRQQMLADLRTRLIARPGVAKPRAVLKQPQAFLMEVGEVFAYPTSGGKCVNSYFKSTAEMPGGWTQDGWGVAIIVEHGRAFEFLVWYRPLTIATAQPDKPLLMRLPSDLLWVLRRPGTCSPVHFKRLGLEKIGKVQIDADKLARSFPTRPQGRSYAVDDISVANSLNIGPDFPSALLPAPGQPPARGRPYPTLAGLDGIIRG